MSSITARPATFEQSPAEMAVGIVGNAHSGSRVAEALAVAGITPVATALSPAELARSGEVELAVGYETGAPGALLKFVREFRQMLPGTPLVAVWPSAHSGDVRRALRAGAAGLVSDTDLLTSLVPTLRAVRSGLACVPQLMRAPLESEPLSLREKQVLGMVVMGLSNSDIAARLYLAESTVKSHLSTAYAKLGVRSRKDAASMVLDPAEGLGPGILAISAA